MTRRSGRALGLLFGFVLRRFWADSRGRGAALIVVFVAADHVAFEDVRERQLDALGDHTDTAALLRLIERGVPADLQYVSPGPP